MNTTQQPNKLIHETSPYLLQHAHNPVNWYPWGEEAFQKAKSENKPIFLSIGYSTCHWCHVMERESFEDRDVAELLNANFISIKVDKEERPDVDSVYMNVCQTLTGSGGWPLTILLTPDQKPFFAGTYFPKSRSYGHPGILELLGAVSEQWRSNPQKLYSTGNEITITVSQFYNQTVQGKQPDKQFIEKAVKIFEREFDSKYGGFGYAPKFPTPHNLMFLLRYYLLENHPAALQMVEKTLQQMYRGGIFDHVGFGFSRYSTDARWLVPHFEKMLYDNALLTIVLIETFQVTKNPLYRTIAEKTLAYIQREMTAQGGGFFSAQDADSEGEEGLFYTFAPSEIESVLGPGDSARLCSHFHVTREGNFEGKNILNLLDNSDFAQIDFEIETMLSRLRKFREKRAALLKDDKILTAWNALMIVAYAKAYRALGEKRYLDTAAKAMQFIRENLMDDKGELWISFRDDNVRGSGLLDDYAFLAWACLELYEATYQAEYLARCESLAEKILNRFSDSAGGFFLNSSEAEKLIFRPKEQYDGATPSGNSAFAYCLAKLAALTGEPRWRQKADQQLEFYYSPFSEHPASHTFALTALMQSVYPSKEVVCVVKDAADEMEAVAAFSRGFFPQTSVIIKTAENAKLLQTAAPFTESYKAEKDRSAYYICENKHCSAPVYCLNDVLKQLNLS